jgi:outer membrane protein TolC
MQSSPRTVTLLLLSLFAFPQLSAAQLDFASAVSLALQHSPRIRSASLDLQKARAGLAEAKDMFIPSLVTGGGLGWTYGITLTVPTIFTINAQSLVYSNQQRFQIRAARDSLDAAQFGLLEARQETEEDVVNTYLALDENQAASAALADQHTFAAKLISILQDRVNAGLDAPIDLKKAQRGALQIELQQMSAEDDRATLAAHLADLTGIQVGEIVTVSTSIPSIPEAKISLTAEGHTRKTPGLQAAEANARGKMDLARGDAGYAWRPIITFAAQYGRISPINNVSSFYNLQNNYNTANIGVVFEFPMIDKVRKAAAQVSMIDALHASADLQAQRSQQAQNLRKLQRSVRMMEIKAEMAKLDYQIAKEELSSTITQLHSPSGNPPLTPKEEQNARMQAQAKLLDLLDAHLQIQKAKITLLRQAGELDQWLHASVISFQTQPIPPKP